MKQITILLFALLIGAYEKTYAQGKPYAVVLHHSEKPDDTTETYIQPKKGQKIVIDHIIWIPAANGHDDDGVKDGVALNGIWVWGPLGNAVLFQSKGAIELNKFVDASNKHTYKDLPIKFVFPLKDYDNEVEIVIDDTQILQLVPNGVARPYLAYVTGMLYE
ncbi:hypothetical protein [uncultured Mucilaginibacter sp.]|uniref:hypothetical protein n=1 Tax=uncultured Mucilaginibacter sp. TaxID=797541 RepID=UPI0025DE1E86|nr:hypothetical protein [uncultured Mucilaginibacter sp.]